MIDVSITVDIHKTEEMKKKKYGPICSWITEASTIKTNYLHINGSNCLIIFTCMGV